MVGVAPVGVVVAHFMGVQRGRNVALGRRLVLNTSTMVVTVMGLRLAVVSGPPCGGMMVWGYARIYNHGRSIGSSSLSCGRTRGHSARVGRYGMSFHAAYGCMCRGMHRVYVTAAVSMWNGAVRIGLLSGVKLLCVVWLCGCGVCGRAELRG